MPDSLEWLITRLESLMSGLTLDVAGELSDPAALEAWQRQVERLLTRYSLAAYMVGNGSSELTDAARGVVSGAVQAQLDFADGFRLDMQDAAEWQAGWEARARQYARSIKVPYWQGRTRVLPLPAMPAQGTQCLTACGCRWRIVPVDEAAGDYECYWELGKKKNCQTCIQRAREWHPLRIQGGVLV